MTDRIVLVSKDADLTELLQLGLLEYSKRKRHHIRLSGNTYLC